MKRLDNRGVAQSFGEGVAAVNSNGQFYTDGRVLFSYGAHWPVAAWVGDVLHINDEKYGKTTSKHRSFAVGGVIRAGLSKRLDTAVHHTATSEFITFLRQSNLMH